MGPTEDAPRRRFAAARAVPGSTGRIPPPADLCKDTHKAQADLTAQNGKTYESKPALVAQCPKRHRKHKRHGKGSRR